LNSTRPSSQRLSLKGRALKYLSAREHSRAELARKLAPHASSLDELDALLNTLEAANWLSAERFVASMVHRKAAQYGTLRMQSELSRHQLPKELTQTAIEDLRNTELERAHALWLKRFKVPANTPQEQAKQARFLASRGFQGDTIRRVLRQALAED
jgi:regulatory protein